MTSDAFRERMKFCFTLMDIDQDGILKAQDLSGCYELVNNSDCKFGRELTVLVDHYSETHLRNREKPSLNDAIDLDKYITLLGRA